MTLLWGMIRADVQTLFRNPRFIAALFVGFVFREWLALRFPLLVDEIYYWDRARIAALSFSDHPPGVNWIATLSARFFAGPLGIRGLVPFFHLGTTLLAALCLIRLGRQSGRVLPGTEMWLILLAQAIPGLHLSGVFLLPDTGLILFLMATFYVLQIHKEMPTLNFSDGVFLGLMGGLCFCFKHHAVVLVPVLLWSQIRTRRLSFWIGLAAALIFASSPDWLWNLREGFPTLSYRLQYHAAQPLSLLRTLALWVGCVLIFTPVFFGGMVARSWRSIGALSTADDLAPGFLNLLLGVGSFFKHVLPHWFVPSGWLMLPGLSRDLRKGVLFWGSVGLGLFCGWVLPAMFCSSSIRQHARSFFGPFDLFEEVELYTRTVEKLSAKQEALLAGFSNVSVPMHCPRPFGWAGLRWYWVSQLAYRLPGQPTVYSFDNRMSAYHARDAAGARNPATNFAGCPFVVVADRQWALALKVKERFSWVEENDLVIPDFEHKPLVILNGILK